MVYLSEDIEGNVVQEERFTELIFLHNNKLIEQFIQTKKLEGCSCQTLQSYKDNLKWLSHGMGKQFEKLTTKDIRIFLSNYQVVHQVKNGTLDNMRRIYSSFYNFLDDESYIMKNPIRKIHKIKEEKIIHSPFSDEEIVRIQDACKNIRETALIDFLVSSGVRVSELCALNKNDINLSAREGVVFGKGAKERIIYFDARTKVHLTQYLQKRTDNNPALFVTQNEPYDRLSKTGVEYIVGKIGMRSNVEKCHPHRFRRTLATRLIDRSVPIEQVQRILGHTKIDTTLIYAQVNQGNVKISHNKFA